MLRSFQTNLNLLGLMDSNPIFVKKEGGKDFVYFEVSPCHIKVELQEKTFVSPRFRHCVGYSSKVIRQARKLNRNNVVFIKGILNYEFRTDKDGVPVEEYISIIVTQLQRA